MLPTVDSLQCEIYIYRLKMRGQKKIFHSNGNNKKAGGTILIVKGILKGKFMAIQAFLKNKQKTQKNNLVYHLEELEKEQINPKVRRRKEIIKIRDETNEIFFKEEKKNQ